MDTAVKSGAGLTDLTFKVEGMSCASCVARVEKALKSVPGVESASINLATEKATVRADPGVGLDVLSTVVEKAGYDVPVETVSLSISGMTCASCVARVEKALKKVPGVTDASVNLATERAHVHARGVPPAMLVAAVERAGYGARVVDAGNASSEPASPSAWPVAIGVALTLPLVAPMALAPFGVDAALPAGWQLALATLVQFGLGARFYRSAWKALRAG